MCTAACHWCMRTTVCCLVLVLLVVCCCSTLKSCQRPCLLHCMWTSAPCLLVIRNMGWARRQQRSAGEQEQSAQSKITVGNLILTTRLGRKIAARAEQNLILWESDSRKIVVQIPAKIITRIRAAACGGGHRLGLLGVWEGAGSVGWACLTPSGVV
jgi:hypothetical protein